MRNGVAPLREMLQDGRAILSKAKVAITVARGKTVTVNRGLSGNTAAFKARLTNKGFTPDEVDTILGGEDLVELFRDAEMPVVHSGVAQ